MSSIYHFEVTNSPAPQGEKIFNSCYNIFLKKRDEHSIGLELLSPAVRRINYMFYRVYSLNAEAQRNTTCWYFFTAQRRDSG